MRIQEHGLGFGDHNGYSNGKSKSNWDGKVLCKEH